MRRCEWPGCVVAGKHVAECQDRDCEACLPRPAARGLLCEKHWAWVNRDLANCAELVLQTREAVAPGSAAESDRVSGGKVSPPAPLDLAAVDASDEMFALLVSSTELACELASQAPPRVPGVWRSGHVVHGFSPRLTPEQCSALTARLVKWWRNRLEDLAGRPDIVEALVDLHQMVSTMTARWPAAERARHLPGTPCRQCDLMDLWWTPPSGEGWPITVECHSCDYVAPEGDLIRLARLVEYEQTRRKVGA